MGSSKDKQALNLYQLAALLAGVGAQFGDPRQQVLSAQLMDSAQGSIEAQATKIEAKKAKAKKGNLGDTVLGGVTGAASGFLTGGPAGAVVGGVSGAASGYMQPGQSQESVATTAGGLAGLYKGFKQNPTVWPWQQKGATQLGAKLSIGGSQQPAQSPTPQLGQQLGTQLYDKYAGEFKLWQ